MQRQLPLHDKEPERTSQERGKEDLAVIKDWKAARTGQLQSRVSAARSDSGSLYQTARSKAKALSFCDLRHTPLGKNFFDPLAKALLVRTYGQELTQIPQLKKH
jgi:hypothetical protein